jgi:hypothetical protein
MNKGNAIQLISITAIPSSTTTIVPEEKTDNVNAYGGTCVNYPDRKTMICYLLDNIETSSDNVIQNMYTCLVNDSKLQKHDKVSKTSKVTKTPKISNKIDDDNIISMSSQLTVTKIEEDDILSKLKNKKIDTSQLKNKRRPGRIVHKLSKTTNLDRYNILQDIYKNILPEYEKYITNEKYNKGRIYKLICKTSKKIYIGSTCNSIDERYINHISTYNYNKTKSDLHQSFEKYGVDDHYIELLELFPCTTVHELLAREDYNILKYNTLNNGLNSKINNVSESFIYCEKNIEIAKQRTRKFVYFKIQKDVLNALYLDNLFYENTEDVTIIYMITFDGKSFINSTNNSLFYGINRLYDKGMIKYNRAKYNNSKMINALANTDIFDLKFSILHSIEKDDSQYMPQIINHYKAKYNTIIDGYNSK